MGLICGLINHEGGWVGWDSLILCKVLGRHNVFAVEEMLDWSEDSWNSLLFLLRVEELHINGYYTQLTQFTEILKLLRAFCANLFKQ